MRTSQWDFLLQGVGGGFEVHSIIRMMEKEMLGRQLEVYCEQVSGKEPKLLSLDRSKLLKGFNAV
jgi:hypothetical protein